MTLPFSPQEHLYIFSLPSPSETCVPPLNFVLERERDPKNIFYYQRDVELYRSRPYFLFDIHEYTHGIFQSEILVSIFLLRVYVTFPLFLQIWITKSIFRGTCVFFWWKWAAITWMALRKQGEIMTENSLWMSNIIILLSQSILETRRISHLHENSFKGKKQFIILYFMK